MTGVEQVDKITIGCDEVGLGALAGPLVVAAVALRDDQIIPGVRDSKEIKSFDRRAELALEISNKALFAAVAGSSAKLIDAEGLSQCKHACMRQCIGQAVQRFPSARVVVDGNDPVPGLSAGQVNYRPKADRWVHSVSAASILAKTFRDSILRELSRTYPEYGWWRNFGYGTAAHIQALYNHGPCKYHRFTYSPVIRAVNL